MNQHLETMHSGQRLGSSAEDAPRPGPDAGAGARVVRLLGLLALLIASVAMIPTPSQAAPSRIVQLRADQATGSTHYPSPGLGSPWVNLISGADGDCENFHGNGVSGWSGKGTHDSPWRLYWEGGKQRVVFAAGSFPALQDSTAPVTAELWFKTSFNGARPELLYLMDWLQAPIPGGNPELEMKGMSIAIQDGELKVYQNDWVSAGAVAPNTWNHVAVVKAPGDLRVYLNGHRAYTGTHPHMGAQTSPLTLGCSVYKYFQGYSGGSVYGDYFSGSIAQASVWSGALSDAEVTASFAADSATYLPNPADPPLMKLVSLRADSSNGATRHAVPGAGGPWVDLTGRGHSASLAGVSGADTTSGWAGAGTGSSPARLAIDGVNDIVVIPAGSIPELQELIPTTTQVWFKTDPDVAADSSHYVVEWLAGTTSIYGLSVETAGGQLKIQRSGTGWTSVAPVAPNHWYQVTITKRPGEMRVYLDGAQVFSTSRPTVGVQGTDLVLGGSTWRGAGQYGDFTKGGVGAFTLWQGVLGDAQIRASFVADSARYLGPLTILANAGAHGSVAPAGAALVSRGDAHTVTITPAACYQVAAVLVDGVSAGAVSSYTFFNVQDDHTLSATFSLLQWTLRASAGVGGTISPVDSVAVPCGGSQAFTITPDACHTVAGLTVDGVPAGAATSYTFTNVTADHTIAASFALKSWTITATAGADGTISPSGAVAVDCGANASFTVTPNACRVVTAITVDGVSVGVVPSYTFTNVQQNHTIAATFAPGSPTITTSATAGGTITPSGTVTLSCGANQSFTVTPNANYHTVDVFVDGVSSGVGPTFAFTNVQISHTVAATFAIDTHALVTAVNGQGTVTRTPDAPVYDHGTSVQLTAAAPPAWAFNGWSGDATGTTNPLMVVINATTVISATFIHVDQTPVAQLLAPNGGEEMFAGDVRTITWSASDDHAVTVDLALSSDDGLTWTPIATGLANTGSYTWTVPLMTGITSRVRVTATDALAQAAADQSNAAFTIRRRLTGILSFRADSASGTSAYPVPSAAGPWTDLAGAYDAELSNFAAPTSGWAGTGVPGDPYRLEYAGTDELASLAPGSIAELQNPTEVTAAVWFRTPVTEDMARYFYLMEWLEEDGKGMAISVHENNLYVYLEPWTSIRTLAPGTWHHVVVIKKLNEVSVYVDGKLRYSGTKSMIGGQTSALTIGASTWRGPGDYGDFYQGAISQVQVYAGAASDAEAKTMYAQTAYSYDEGTLAVGGSDANGLSLLGTANPARGNLRVSFSLADARPARLELLDLAGRRVRDADVTAFGPGRHGVDLARESMPAPGMYWVRLSQGGRAITKRVAVIQ